MLFDTSRDWWGLLAYLILSFLLLIFMLYLAINQPKFFVSYFSEVYLSLIMVRDYRYFVICHFIVAVFIAVLSLLPCDWLSLSY